MLRIRQCVECPRCHTRYVISRSPYRNGAYLIPTMNGSSDEYTLYCSCSGGSVGIRWRWSEVKACEVSKAAYDRGYGTPDEVMTINPQACDNRSVDVSRYVNKWKSGRLRSSTSSQIQRERV